MSARGLRNNNPGNIRHNPNNKWQGLSEDQPDREFCKFRSMAYGVRAMAITLISYQDKYGLNTIGKLIGRWAPPKGDRNGAAPGGEYTQDTNSYSMVVAARVGVPVDQELNVHDYNDMRPLLEGMIRVECAIKGRDPLPKECDGAVIDRGLELAGIAPPPKPLTQSETVKGQTTAAVGGTAATAVAVMSQFDDVLGYTEVARVTLAEWAPLLAPGSLQKVIFVAAAIALAITLYGAGKALYARWKEHKRVTS